MYPNLRAEMARHNMTMTNISKEMGIAKSSLSERLNGKRQITVNEAIKIKSVIGTDLSLEELFKEVL